MSLTFLTKEELEQGCVDYTASLLMPGKELIQNIPLRDGKTGQIIRRPGGAMYGPFYCLCNVLNDGHRHIADANSFQSYGAAFAMALKEAHRYLKATGNMP